MTVQTVSHHADGSASTSTGGTQSSDAAPQGEGYHVRSGMHGRVTNDLSQVADTDLITIQGMEVTVAMARDMGLINAHKPDTGLSVGNAVPEDAPEVSTDASTGHAGYDQSLAELNTQVEAGSMTSREASEYSTALGQVALADMTVAEVSDAIDGTVDLSELDQNQRDVIRNTESRVTEAATKSATTELGPEAFQRLSKIAAASPEVNQAIRQYAGLRAVGRGDVSWSEFMQDVDDHVAGNR